VHQTELAIHAVTVQVQALALLGAKPEAAMGTLWAYACSSGDAGRISDATGAAEDYNRTA
jgi:hypothetical protein